MYSTFLLVNNLDFSIQGKLWLSNLQEPGALIGNTDEFSNTLAAGLAPNTILFGVFQSISGYGGEKIVAEEWRLVIFELNQIKWPINYGFEIPPYARIGFFCY